jgi:dihydroorotate dehydrogenase electron transfer subunit
MGKGTVHRGARIMANVKIAPDYYRLTVDVGTMARSVRPGQFFTIRCSDDFDPLLRRPFSVHRISGQGPMDSPPRGSIEVLYQVVGRATEHLSKKRKGTLLDIIGPLGRGFPLRSTERGLWPSVLVAGGMGVAPLRAVAEELAHDMPSRRCAVIIGAKTKRELLCERDFKKLGCEVLLATEDGSRGTKGLATEVLKELLLTIGHRPLAIYACGPNLMLQAIAKMTTARTIDAYGSFEEHMACGVGSCYGCVIATKQGYKRVCNDGPVFDLREIIWRD